MHNGDCPIKAIDGASIWHKMYGYETSNALTVALWSPLLPSAIHAYHAQAHWLILTTRRLAWRMAAHPSHPSSHIFCHFPSGFPKDPPATPRDISRVRPHQKKSKQAKSPAADTNMCPRRCHVLPTLVTPVSSCLPESSLLFGSCIEPK